MMVLESPESPSRGDEHKESATIKELIMSAR